MTRAPRRSAPPRRSHPPLLAAEDALLTFDADEIVVVTRTGDDASWLEEGAAETITARFPQLPVKTIEL